MAKDILLSDLVSDSGVVNKTAVTDLICRFCDSEWPLVSPDDVSVTAVSSSYSSLILIVQRKSSSSPQTEPEKLVLRLPKHRTQEESDLLLEAPVTEELMTCALFSQTACGVRVFGVFAGVGRIDQHIVSHSLTSGESEDPQILSAVACAYARLHSCKVPIDRSRGATFDSRVQKLLSHLKDNDDVRHSGRDYGIDVSLLVTEDFVSAHESVTSYLRNMRAEKCVCHIDPNFANILVVDEGRQRSDNESLIKLIDWEFVNWNFRAVDIGGLFFEKTVNWSSTGNKRPAAGRDFTEAEKRLFCCQYLSERQRLGSGPQVSDQSISQLMCEARAGLLMRLLFCISCAVRHCMRFGFNDSAILSLIVWLHQRFLYYKTQWTTASD